jgi:hypothetical protein
MTILNKVVYVFDFVFIFGTKLSQKVKMVDDIFEYLFYFIGIYILLVIVVGVDLLV